MIGLGELVSGGLRLAEPPDEDAAARGAPVRSQLLHIAVADRLRAMIVEGHLRPGERINEVGLSSRLGVSRTPFREALKILQSEGLVDHVPNRGARVSQITPEHTAELFEAMGGIERCCGEITARKISDEQIAWLRALHQRMDDAYRAEDRQTYLALNERIHRAYVELSGNTILKTFHDKLIVGARRVRYLAIQSLERWRESLAEHAAIMDALATHDARTAGALIEQHIRNTGNAICITLSNSRAGSS